MSPRMALKLAKNARHKVHHHACLVYRGGALVAMGVNHDFVHAEVSALNSLWPSERRGTKIVSIRVTRAGKLSMAKPCPKCEAYLRENGVKSVLYSTRDGRMEKMKL